MMTRESVMDEMQIPRSAPLNKLVVDKEVLFLRLIRPETKRVWATFSISGSMRERIQLSKREPEEFFRMILFEGVDPIFIQENGIDPDIFIALNGQS